MKHDLRLHHELLLLALSDDKGTVAFGGMLSHGLGGALLTELLLANRVEIVHEGRDGKKQFVELRDSTPFREPALDLALERIASGKRRASPVIIVSRLGNIPKLRHTVAQELCRAGVLQETEQQILLLFRRRVYPTIDGRAERAIVRRIQSVLGGGKTPDERTAALIGLANLTGALAAIYTRAERRTLKSRLKLITESTAGSQAAAQAVAAAHSAAMAATTAAIIAAS